MIAIKLTVDAPKYLVVQMLMKQYTMVRNILLLPANWLRTLKGYQPVRIKLIAVERG